MGLDSVELVMAFEEEFGLEIPDAAAEKFERPADVIDHVAYALAGFGAALCPSQRAFHQIRGTLIEMGQPRSAIRVETQLAELFPRRGRRAAWQRMREALKPVRWAKLERPQWLRRALVVSTFALPGATLLFVYNGSSQPIGIGSWLAALLLSAVCTAVLLFRLTKPLATQFPAIQTVGDLTQRIGAVGRMGAMHANGTLSRSKIAEAVRQITIDQLDLSQDEYDEDKHFVRDLGMD